MPHMYKNLNIYITDTDCKASVGEDEQGTTKLILRNPAKAKNKQASGSRRMNKGTQTPNALA